MYSRRPSENNKPPPAWQPFPSHRRQPSVKALPSGHRADSVSQRLPRVVTSTRSPACIQQQSISLQIMQSRSIIQCLSQDPFFYSAYLKLCIDGLFTYQLCTQLDECLSECNRMCPPIDKTCPQFCMCSMCTQDMNHISIHAISCLSLSALSTGYVLSLAMCMCPTSLNVASCHAFSCNDPTVPYPLPYKGTASHNRLPKK